MTAAWIRAFAPLAAVGAALVALRMAVVRPADVPNVELFPDMARGAAVRSQGDGAATSDGLACQPLPDGVVPRDVERFRYGASAEEATRAGAELASPFDPADAVAAKRGAEVYARFCLPCHGADGGGQGPVVLRGMVQPPSLLAARALDMKDGQMFHVLTRGQGNMASYAAQVRPEDRWRAILHVRALQKGGAK